MEYAITFVILIWIPACTGMTMKLLFTMLVFVIPHLLQNSFYG